MKKALKASVLANLLLTACAIVLLHTRISTSPAGTVQNSAASSLPPREMPPNSSAAEAFNWSQIESEDYRTYIVNLRRIRCPEPTIRDIIKADVGELYKSRRNALENNADLPRNVQRLREEGSWVIATLLGEEPEIAERSPARDVPPRSGRTRSAEKIASLPMVFQDVDVSQLKLNREQLQAIEDLRQRFLDEIGGLEQNPNDAAYRERWLKSQPQIDDDLRGMIGVAAFQDYQIQAVDLAEKTGKR